MMFSTLLSGLIVSLTVFSWSDAFSTESPQALDRCDFNPHGTPPLRVSELEKDGWSMVFRGTAANGHSIYHAWVSGVGTTQIKPKTMARTHDDHYRNHDIDHWTFYYLHYIKVGLYKNSQEVGYIVFDARGSKKTNWFSKSRLVASSWSDMTRYAAYNVFSINGYTNRWVERRFHINLKYHGCPLDLGYLTVVEKGKKGCLWDQHYKYPQILYSDTNAAEYWQKRMFGRADYMAIFVKPYHALTSSI